jgi:CHAT domain-containing protein
MGEVPFAVLYGSRDTIALGMRYTLRFAPALSLLKTDYSANRARRPELCTWSECDLGNPTVRRGALNTTAAARRQWLAGSIVVGDPVMPPVIRADTRQPIEFEQLAGARDEAAAVARIAGVPPMIGPSATETAVRARLPKARLVHLATHGFAYGDARNAGASFVALARDARHDGLLTADELLADSALTLAAELVVLSACETARGAANQGEGTIGLQRAFLARGAQTVLVSQWRVPDAATRLLMEEFYKGWLDPTLSLSKTKALQRAQSIVRSRPEFAAPANWAAFQLVGAR